LASDAECTTVTSSKEVWQKVEGEIAGNWYPYNHHGIVLSKCLIGRPQLREYKVLDWPPKKLADGRTEFRYSVVKLWLVLEEKPDTKDGYKIVYDEKADMFGLALASTSPVPGEIFIGCYGSFLETLEAM